MKTILKFPFNKFISVRMTAKVFKNIECGQEIVITGMVVGEDYPPVANKSRNATVTIQLKKLMVGEKPKTFHGNDDLETGNLKLAPGGRTYGKQYNAFLRCVKQIEAGQNTVFVGRKWMMISTDYYQKLTSHSKIEIKSIDRNPFPYIKPKWNTKRIKSMKFPIHPALYDRLKELNILPNYVIKDEFINLKREETMKSNIGIAAVCHEANRQYCIDNKLPTQALWNELPVTQQNSMISGVQQVIANPKITAAESHENWLEYKASEGWKYAKELDAAKKLHPNMVPFNKLTEVERAKDILFIKTVKAELKK